MLKFSNVSVSTPCACAVKCSGQWWSCKTSVCVAEYVLNRELDGGTPFPEDIKYIAKLYPGKDLLFNDGGFPERYTDALKGV